MAVRRRRRLLHRQEEVAPRLARRARVSVRKRRRCFEAGGRRRGGPREERAGAGAGAGSWGAGWVGAPPGWVGPGADPEGGCVCEGRSDRRKAADEGGGGEDRVNGSGGGSSAAVVSRARGDRQDTPAARRCEWAPEGRGVGGRRRAAVDQCTSGAGGLVHGRGARQLGDGNQPVMLAPAFCQQPGRWLCDGWWPFVYRG